MPNGCHARSINKLRKAMTQNAKKVSANVSLQARELRLATVTATPTTTRVIRAEVNLTSLVFPCLALDSFCPPATRQIYCPIYSG